MDERENKLGKSKPEQFSILGLYGDRTTFLRRLEAGYCQVAFGGGPWVSQERIVGIFAFFLPKDQEGEIVTIERRKFISGGMDAIGRNEGKYSYDEYESLLAEYQVTMSERSELRELVDRWSE